MTKKIILCLLVAIVAFSCKNSSSNESQTADSVAANTPTEARANTDSALFDIQSVPVSEVALGEFPYLSYPEGYNFNYHKEIEAKDIKEVDKEYFAVAGKLVAVEGKSFKVRIDRDSEAGKLNRLVVEKYYATKIQELGGVRVNNIPVPKSEIERIGDKELIEQQYGFSIDYNMLDDVQTYLIKRKDREIWIQMMIMDSEIAKLTVLEKKTK